MKKFGTPIGAGPGIAKEKVGLAGVGTPLCVVGAGGLGGCLAGVVEEVGPDGPLEPPRLGPVGPEDPVVPLEPPEPWRLPPLLLPPPPFGCEPEDPLGPVEEEGVELEPDDPLVETLGVLLVVLGVHEADTLFTGPTPAGTIEAGGVPGGTLTLKLSVWPVSSVTVTVHWSAEAVGRAAIPRIANTDAAEDAAIFSFRRVDNLTRLLPPLASRIPRQSAALHAG